MNYPRDAPGPRGYSNMTSWSDSPPVDEMISLMVGNLSPHSTTDCLRRVFMEYGRIGDVHRPKDSNYGFVRFLNRRDAEEAMRSLDGVRLNGRTLRVNMAHCSVRPGKSNSPSRRQTHDSRSRSRSRSKSKSNYDSPSRSRGLKFETQHQSVSKR